MDADKHIFPLEPQAPAPEQRCRRWCYNPKDVVIMSLLALVMSGLVGLGAVMLVEILDRLLP